MSRKTLIIIPVILVALVVLGAVIALNNPEYYREQIKTTVEAETGFIVQINGELKWRYWPPIAIRIEDVDVRSAGADTPLATLKSAAVDLKILPLILGSGDIAIDGLNIDGLTLNAIVDKQGRGNWETDREATEAPLSENSASDSGSQDSLELDIGAMSITNAAVSYQDNSTGEHYELTLNSINTGAISYSEPTPMSFNLSLEDKISGLTSNINGEGGLSFNSSFTQFGLIAVNIESEIEESELGKQAVNLIISGDVDTARGTASLSQLDFKMAELNGSVVVNVTDMNAIPKLEGQIKLAPFNAKSFMKTLKQPEIDTTNPTALNAVSLSAEFGGTTENIKFSNITGKIDDSTISGRLEIRVGDKLTSSFDIKLDQISLSDYLAPTVAAGPVNTKVSDTTSTDSEVLPVSLLNEHNIDGRFTIGRIEYESYSLTEFTTTIVNANQQLKATASGKGYDGNINIEFIAKTGSKPTGSMNMELKGMDVTKLAELEALTGTVELISQTEFSGSMLSDVLATLDGKSEFTIRNGTLDVKPIKNIASVIDGLRGKPSAVASWPDIMPFKSMVGTHQLNQGVAKNQQLKMTLENLTLQGTGGLDYWQNLMDYDMEVTLQESVGGQFTVGPAMAGVKWPLQCAGSLDATVAELCTPDSESLSQLVSQILQKELQRQGSEKLRKKGKKLLEGLFD